MKRSIVVLLLGVFALGCGPRPSRPPVLARVNDYEITQEEFELEFRDSRYAAAGTPQAKKEFLENLINRKLMLQDAQARGLDKDPAFLKAIERFWEQSLLKIYLEQKIAEIVSAAAVDDKAVEAAYRKMSDAARAGRSYQKLYPQIKWELAKAREAELMNAWVAQLRQGAQIQVDEVLLNSKR